jgi:SNF2 family DNA or RNA helicase
MLCDEQGLGKTLQTIALMHVNTPPPMEDGSRARFRTLVVCPVTLIDQWIREIRRFSK